jgi:hypothetical protein
MQRLWSVLLFMAVSKMMAGPVHAQPLPPTQVEPQAAPSPQARQLNTDAAAGFRIEFLGKEPSADWARVAGSLVDSKLVPLETLQLSKGQDPCEAVLEALDFRRFKLGCSREMREFIRKLNPKLSFSSSTVNYPGLPIEGTTNWFAGFDFSEPGEEDRYKKVVTAWRALKIGETRKGDEKQPLVQVEFRGFQATIASSESAALKNALKEIERYDPNLKRFDTRVLPLSTEPLSMKPFSMKDPMGAAELCVKNPTSPPSPPLPAYISLLGGSKDDLKCVNKCMEAGACPEIVLIDQQVAHHPDIADSLLTEEGVGATPDIGTPNWCPFVPFNEDLHHGTHMAGLMVSSGKTSSFLGLAPTARLNVKNIGKLFDQNIPTIAKASSYGAPNTSFNLIVVFASQFPLPKKTLPDGSVEFQTTLLNGELRHTNPRYVSDILASQRLWIVAAGQPETKQGREIGTHDYMSPMNLGDHTGVLVVTACEDCYSDQPAISPWANYSGNGPGSGGLVNLAAPGGTKASPIPSTITGLKYGLAYGTSQATALVGGLAAAMMSCYPTTYVTPKSLKFRLLATSMPSQSQDVARKITAGIVDASEALLDPAVHWVRRKSNNGVRENFKDVRWCKQNLTLIDENQGGGAHTVDVRQIRRIVKSSTDSDSWFIFYVVEPTGIDPTMWSGIVGIPSDRMGSLLYFGDGPKTAGPSFPLDEIQDLLIGLGATSKVLTNFAGCTS